MSLHKALKAAGNEDVGVAVERPLLNLRCDVCDGLAVCTIRFAGVKQIQRVSLCGICAGSTQRKLRSL